MESLVAQVNNQIQKGLLVHRVVEFGEEVFNVFDRVEKSTNRFVPEIPKPFKLFFMATSLPLIFENTIDATSKLINGTSKNKLNDFAIALGGTIASTSIITGALLTMGYEAPLLVSLSVASTMAGVVSDFAGVCYAFYSSGSSKENLLNLSSVILFNSDRDTRKLFSNHFSNYFNGGAHPHLALAGGGDENLRRSPHRVYNTKEAIVPTQASMVINELRLAPTNPQRQNKPIRESLTVQGLKEERTHYAGLSPEEKVKEAIARYNPALVNHPEFMNATMWGIPEITMAKSIFDKMHAGNQLNVPPSAVAVFGAGYIPLSKPSTRSSAINFPLEQTNERLHLDLKGASFLPLEVLGNFFPHSVEGGRVDVYDCSKEALSSLQQKNILYPLYGMQSERNDARVQAGYWLNQALGGDARPFIDSRASLPTMVISPSKTQLEKFHLHQVDLVTHLIPKPKTAWDFVSYTQLSYFFPPQTQWAVMTQIAYHTKPLGLILTDVALSPHQATSLGLVCLGPHRVQSLSAPTGADEFVYFYMKNTPNIRNQEIEGLMKCVTEGYR